MRNRLIALVKRCPQYAEADCSKLDDVELLDLLDSAVPIPGAGAFDVLFLPPEVKQLQSSPGLLMILVERGKQIANGYDADHDDGHDAGEIMRAAGCYADTAVVQISKPNVILPPCYVHKNWPWDRASFRPRKTALKNTIKAAALLLAEVQRQLRAVGAEHVCRISIEGKEGA